MFQDRTKYFRPLGRKRGSLGLGRFLAYGAMALLCVSNADVRAETEAEAEVEIEGDQDLVEVALAAQRTNAAKYPRGRMKADVVLKVDDSVTTAEVATLWDHEAAYWTYRSETQQGTTQSKWAAELIVTEGLRIDYSPQSKLVQISRGSKRKVSDVLKIRPMDLWFKIDGSRLASEMLDPKFNSEALPKYVIFEKGTNQIVIQRHYKAGGYCQFIVDLSRDGNVISYDKIPKSSEGVWIRGSFDWQQTDGGQWYVKFLKMERAMKDKGGQHTRSIEVKVAEYEDDPQIPTDRFTLKSLNIPPDTTVEEFGADGKRISRRKPPAAAKLNTKTLDPLVETLKSGRLAKPSK